MATRHIFLPYVRQGAARLIESVDFVGTLDARAKLDMNVTVGAGNTSRKTENILMRLYGPGEVLGFDARQVVRTEPHRYANDFEPNYFPFIEFDRADFPWLFTPAKAASGDKLRPWICLVAIPKTSELLVRPDAPLPILKVANPAQDLPDLSESWLWAHAQVTISGGTPGQDDNPQIRDALLNQPAFNLSRLLCPRKLQEKTTYIACVVPAFETGVLAGLGQADEITDDAKLEDAWEAISTNPIELPVYYSWEFTTGLQGDFETLARKLQPTTDELLSKVEGQPFSLAQPGGGLPSQPDTLKLQGALAPKANAEADTPPSDFTDALRTLVNAETKTPADLPIPPPIYGCWQAAKRALDGSGVPIWLHDLNLNPVYRTAAALGVQVVQANQEDLMASAWDQLGEIEKANQLLRQAQLARDASNLVYKELFTLSERSSLPTPDLPLETLSITAPVHARVKMQGASNTVYHAIKQNVSVHAAFTAAFRRFARPRGPLARRFTMVGGRGFADFPVDVNDSGGAFTRPNTLDRRGEHQFDEVFAALKTRNPDTSLCGWVNQLVAQIKERTMLGLDSLSPKLLPVWDALADQLCRRTIPPSVPTMINFRSVGASLVPALDPETTIVKRVKVHVQHEIDNWQPADPLEPIMVAPEFPTPMYKKLAELSQEYFLPGVEQIPQNSVLALSTNRRFIEAFMAGLNHEMSRELLWREFPTDQRGTYFRQFWDIAGRVPPPADPRADALKDIAYIHQWKRDARLGANGSDSSPSVDRVVLLVRGELLYRYPRTIIYMVEAREPEYDFNGVRKPRSPQIVEPPGQEYPAHEKYPVFSGSLTPDMLFFGFDVSRETAKGDPGYFFVFQQPPTELRFGLDEAPPEPPARKTPDSWKDLTWSDVVQRGGYLLMSSGAAGAFATTFEALQVAPSLTDHWNAAAPAHKLTMNSAQFARITQQDPLRVAIHASGLLP